LGGKFRLDVPLRFPVFSSATLKPRSRSAAIPPRNSSFALNSSGDGTKNGGVVAIHFTARW
jgi:hypothetical protein